MNSNYEDLEAAIRGDTARLRDEEGNVVRGLAYAAAFTAVIIALCWLAYQFGFFSWFRDHALYLIAGTAVICLGAIAMHQGLRAGMNGE